MVIDPLLDFAKDSQMLINACEKPGKKGTFYSSFSSEHCRRDENARANSTEFLKIAMATGIGFCIMGFIGFFVKLVHIPINNIIVGR